MVAGRLTCTAGLSSYVQTALGIPAKSSLVNGQKRGIHANPYGDTRVNCSVSIIQIGRACTPQASFGKLSGGRGSITGYT